MNRFTFFFLVIVASAGFLGSCQDDYESYSTSPSDVLSFSHDTLTFDTLISTIGSTTKRIMVYNHNKKALRISSISLAGGNNGFRLNVDGERNNSFSDIDIRGKDSLYIFVETTLKETGENTPVIMSDSLIFTTNTVQQKVILQAYGQDAYIWKNGGVIERDSTLKNDKPYLIYDSLHIKEGATLTIPEGITIYLHDKTKIDVYGRLKIAGNANNPVTIRGDRLDKQLGISYDLQAGQWQGIRFYAQSYENEIHHARIRNGVHGLICDSADVTQSKLKITNTILTNVYYNLLSATNCNIEASNCEFSNAGGALLSLAGGSYSFIHCTIANHFQLGYRTGPSLVLRNYTTLNREENKADSIPLHLLKADFLNCIIEGSQLYEISFDKINEKRYPNTDFNYRMDYCLLKMNYEDLNTTRVTNFILNENPVFAWLNDSRKDYTYSYLLKDMSPAINQGSFDYMTATDLNGEPRPKGSKPDLGAYECR